MKKILVYGMSNDYGGIQSFFLHFINHVDQNKIKFEFLLSSASPVKYADEIQKNNGKIHTIVPWGSNPIKHRHELKSFFKRNKYDFVWTNSTSASNISIYKIVKEYANAKLIIHSHGSAFETRNKGIKKNMLNLLHLKNKNKLTDFADYRFAVSDKASNWLFGEESKNNDDIFIINNGIDTDKYQYDLNKRNKVREELGIGNSYVVMQIGRIEKVKNHQFSLEVLKELLELKPNSKLVIIGDGSLKEQITEIAKSLSLSKNVLFLGYKNNVHDYLQGADCLILPSFSEGLPLTVVEAQASGLQCIVSEEAVPLTADITGLVSYKSIYSSPKEWATEISQFKVGYSRAEYSKRIKNMDFDINNTVKEVTRILNL